MNDSLPSNSCLRCVQIPSRPGRHLPGFTLPAVLFVLGALLLLVLGALQQSGTARDISRADVAACQAGLAVRAGLETVRHQLREATANDEYLVVCHEGRDGADPPSLYVVQPSTSQMKTTFRHVPLFSTATSPGPTEIPAPLPPESLLAGPAVAIGTTEIEARPYQSPARVGWIPLLDPQGRMIARYAYWAEDLQAKLDVTRCGNSDGMDQTHLRNAWPGVAPGQPRTGPVDFPGSDDASSISSQVTLPQIPLYPLDPEATEDGQRSFGRNLIALRHIMLSPGAPMFATGLDCIPPRQPGTRFSHPLARAAEECLTVGLHPYLEQPRIPHSSAIHPSARGLPKMNLNRQVGSGDRINAVTGMAELVRKALPQFEARKGGLTDDYIATLCASVLDYADSDSTPTLIPSGPDAPPCRGIDSYPLVSEFLMRFRWENVIKRNGRKIVILSASTYAELWNPCDRVVTGEVRFSYETAYSFSLAANPEVSLADHTTATPTLPIEDGLRWFPAQTITLLPDEYRVVKFGTVTYEFDAGPESAFIPSPLELRGEIYGASGCGYHLKWNGVLADGSRGGIHRNNASLNYPKDSRDFPRQRTRATIPGHSHTRSGSFRNNPGDPRMAWLLHAPQDANRYPDNYSPNRRNIRWGTIYRDDLPSKPKIHGRVMPSEWPDGGHNSSTGPFSWHTTDERILPDDPVFFPDATSPLRQARPESAPQRISNAGYFLSATELGHIHDPILWKTSQPTAANLPWGDVRQDSTPDSDFGGGNTLRIGRPEHPRFLQAESSGMEAWRWLDLFHVGRPGSPSISLREGPLVSIAGAINLNTADPQVIRCLVYGALNMDPAAARRIDDVHDLRMRMGPPTTFWNPSAEELNRTAERITAAILTRRRVSPFLSVAEILTATDEAGRPVFGDLTHLDDPDRLELSDSAREEWFARIHDASTVRSRHFRVRIIGQAVTPQDPASEQSPEILAESHRCYSLFADPGTRLPDGSIDPASTRIRIFYESDF